MRITCPSCAASYDVPAALLAPGRAVRCARCGTEWAPEAEAPPPPPAPPPHAAAPRSPIAPPSPPPVPSVPPPEPVCARLGADPAAAPPMPETSPRADRGARRLALAGWAATALVLAAATAAAWRYRAPIEAGWPPSQRAYALLGLD